MFWSANVKPRKCTTPLFKYFGSIFEKKFLFQALVNRNNLKMHFKNFESVCVPPGSVEWFKSNRILKLIFVSKTCIFKRNSYFFKYPHRQHGSQASYLDKLNVNRQHNSSTVIYAEFEIAQRDEAIVFQILKYTQTRIE